MIPSGRGKAVIPYRSQGRLRFRTNLGSVQGRDFIKVLGRLIGCELILFKGGSDSILVIGRL